ncbi:TraR/DksA family transcriptional regulator [Pseudodesulfovibrio sp. JC047]|uniref:TraR/DksA family transcriptional regulator n=1 Tax=Pseudodesulfovibrio sp. JC047 TaxID=2683199 RepID=UPI0013CF6547|nr:TraR/DksA C4-type zinc finger protein [Pseudodesulfovibrio sp. JC047]NDV19683.1 TraR/DksA family transcriptional regulator [Pseudodesulfovibrio sp. JC047]
MTDAQKREFRAYAQAEIDGLKTEIPRLETLVQPVAPDNAIGRISRMDTIVNQSVTKAQLSKCKIRLVRLKAALERVDDEDFGLCVECDEPIPMARLKAMPETQLCVECAD